MCFDRSIVHPYRRESDAWLHMLSSDTRLLVDSSSNDVARLSVDLDNGAIDPS